MPGDRARVSYDPGRKWRGVIAQQGRVTVEADWNEAAMIGRGTRPAGDARRRWPGRDARRRLCGDRGPRGEPSTRAD